ncbi:MAG: DUF2911 domain-containing protein [Saprospiraceae bacterium]|nr:DUF2911 domain-containing protein [Saprospiraceae bacterium]
MKYTYMVIALILTIPLIQAQPFHPIDKSPLDIAYFPDNFAHDRSAGDAALIRVIYSRPQKNGREIFGNLVPYGKVWRAGANENTEIKLYRDATVSGKPLPAGTYSLFTIPDKNEWTIIFNHALDFWGAYSYDEAKDALRIKVPRVALTKPVEYFSILFQDNDNGGIVMKLAWDTTLIEVPFQF